MVSLAHVRGMGTKAIVLISHRHGFATAAATGTRFAPLAHAVLGEGPGVRALSRSLAHDKSHWIASLRNHASVAACRHSFQTDEPKAQSP